MTNDQYQTYKNKKSGSQSHLEAAPGRRATRSAPRSASPPAGPDSKPILIADQTSGRAPWGNIPLRFVVAQRPLFGLAAPRFASRPAQTLPAAPARPTRRARTSSPRPSPRLAPAARPPAEGRT